MDTSIYSRPDKELLEWELSLKITDLRSASWYHGNISRCLAEHLLEDDGEFLVRDSSTFSRTGDYVLSTKWNGNAIHFLIHKEVLQPNTIYEQLGYRFENESFTTVSDLITHYVGNKEPISARSGCIISYPRTRTVPISRKHRLHSMTDAVESADYALINGEPVLPVEAFLIEKSFTPESLSQVALNLKPPPDLFQDLEFIPEKIRNLEEYKKNVSFDSVATNAGLSSSSNFDLSTFSSILLPIKIDDAQMNSSLIEDINSRILEVSDRAMAFQLTQADWKVLKMEFCDEDASPEEPKAQETLNLAIYENILNNKQFRWNHIIERSLSFSHFVTITAQQGRENVVSKWIGIANEVKSAMGNFWGFCNIMRGLTCTSLNSAIDWMKLRREYTNSAFLFETNLRNAYHNLLQGAEAYPPNTTLPNLFPVAVILEDSLELFPLLKNCSEQDKLKMTVAHLRQFYMFSDNENLYNRNWSRIIEDSNVSPDIVLSQIFLTQTQLLILWGSEYNSQSLLDRCKQFDDTFY